MVHTFIFRFNVPMLKIKKSAKKIDVCNAHVLRAFVEFVFIKEP